MTVREHLFFHAMVRMGAKIPVQTRLDRVQEVLTEAALVHCADTYIGGAGPAVRGMKLSSSPTSSSSSSSSSNNSNRSSIVIE